MTTYAQIIREILARRGDIGRYDVRHVESYLRLEHSTLDSLSRERFASEVAIACACIDEGGIGAAESLARSFGF